MLLELKKPRLFLPIAANLIVLYIMSSPAVRSGSTARPIVATAPYDRNKQFSYELARLIASKLVQDPSLLQCGRKYLERHVRTCPHQRRYYGLWSRLLELEPQEIAARLLAKDADGELLRDTRPVFYVPTIAEREQVLKTARRSGF